MCTSNAAKIRTICVRCVLLISKKLGFNFFSSVVSTSSFVYRTSLLSTLQFDFMLHLHLKKYLQISRARFCRHSRETGSGKKIVLVTIGHFCIRLVEIIICIPLIHGHMETSKRFFFVNPFSHRVRSAFFSVNSNCQPVKVLWIYWHRFRLPCIFQMTPIVIKRVHMIFTPFKKTRIGIFSSAIARVLVCWVSFDRRESRANDTSQWIVSLFRSR